MVPQMVTTVKLVQGPAFARRRRSTSSAQARYGCAVGQDTITTIISTVGASVSVLTLAAIGWRERRESTARAEQRAKAIIDLLRIADSPSEPAAVREFAKRELRRMKARFDEDQET